MSGHTYTHTYIHTYIHTHIHTHTTTTIYNESTEVQTLGVIRIQLYIVSIF